MIWNSDHFQDETYKFSAKSYIFRKSYLLEND